MKIKKSNKLYVLIIATWVTLLIFGLPPLLNMIYSYFEVSPLVSFILIINLFFIVYFWLNGTKDIFFVIFFNIFKGKHHRIEKEIINKELPEKLKNAKVLLLYCTCNDFIEDSLFKSMQQSHKNTEVIILDDSSDEKYLQQVDEFAAKHSIKVVRRDNRVGFKAGNLNNTLQKMNNNEYDFFVILDSDEIIPYEFTEKALHYFAYYNNLGILQANHISTRDRTKFMKRFSMGVDAHWPVYQTVKERYGFLSLLGHGAMMSYDCFQAVGGFPELVAEDLCITIEAKLKGFDVAFSNEIVCEEEYPIDYFAFKKRHLKWSGGNLEFIKTYHKKIFSKNKLKWYEKLDLFLFTYNLPMASVFFIFLCINLIALPLLHSGAGYAVWLMVPTTIYLFSPMLNDMIYLLGRISPLRYVQYLFECFLLQGSLYWLSFYGATKALFGVKAKFIVTPKDEQKYTYREMIMGNIQEIIFSLVLSLVSVLISDSILPVILIIIPSLSGVYLTSLADEYKEKDKKTVDKAN